MISPISHATNYLPVAHDQRADTARVHQLADKATSDLDDAILTAKVQAAVLNDPNLKASNITVDTINSKVHLSGIVSLQANIALAVRLVRNIEGVSAVANGLRLQ
ncbi:BON domain-containing protein [Chitinimonas naiadis]